MVDLDGLARRLKLYGHLTIDAALERMETAEARCREARRLIQFWWDEEGCTDAIMEDVRKFLGSEKETPDDAKI